MNKIFLPILLGLLLNVLPLHSQDIYMPAEYRKALVKNTRSLDGKPGTAYWQNYSDYFIEADVNSNTKEISGKEKIIYHNKSPHDLSKLVIRLYQDFLKPGKSRDWEGDPKYFGEGTVIKKLTINGFDIDTDSKDVKRPGTNMVINLSNSTLKAGMDNVVDIEWSFKIPEEFPRMGMYDSTSYMIAYWYPQISVFDDIEGWDMIDYNGIVEFYNDFSNFDVRIKTDRPNMIVWSTGLLQNPEEVFNDGFLIRYRDAAAGNSKLEIDCSTLNSSNQITRNNGSSVWHYKAESVPDFVFSMSDHYFWQMKRIEAADNNFVILSTAFRPNALSLKFDVYKIAEEAIKYLATTMPGVPFPYPSMTVFNGEGGMEFPMMVNDGDEDDWESLIYLTSHEISHTYFPFMTGINERKYAWMDEGFAVFLPMDFQIKMDRFGPDNKERDPEKADQREYFVKSFNHFSGTFNDVPMLTPSNLLKSVPYRFNAYGKSEIVFEILKDMLGEELFNKALKEFIARWGSKHPMPYDFFFTFNDVSKKDLNWFWTRWFMQSGTADLSISAAVVTSDKMEIKVTNKGGMPVPIAVTLTFEDGSESYHKTTAEVWKDASEYRFTVEVKKKVKSIKLGNGYIPDVNPEDNGL